MLIYSSVWLLVSLWNAKPKKKRFSFCVSAEENTRISLAVSESPCKARGVSGFDLQR